MTQLTSPLQLRDGSERDLPAMAEVIAAAWRGGYRGILDDSVIDAMTPDRWQELLAEPATQPRRTVLGVTAAGEVVGFVRYGPDPDPPHGGYIASVYVDPRAAGQGLGSRLTEHAISQLAADGHDDLRLWVFRDNARARALYERCGFAPDGGELTDPHWGVPQVSYRRRLVAPDPPPVAVPAGERLTVISPTEERNPRTADLDRLPALELLQRINDEDARVSGAVREVLPALAQLVEITVKRLGEGGQVHYFGAGSSGRLGLLDAAELPPTFGIGPDLFIAHLAGGDAAVRRAQEGAEDDAEQGAREASAITSTDVVIGLASSGYTPYVAGALGQARAAGAHTVLITSNPDAPLAVHADTLLCVQTGPEALTGSTRMKSATAQKLVLNAFSTAVMVRLGRTWSNLMVDLMPSNAKLRGRLLKLLRQATGRDEAICEAHLVAAGHEPKTALVTLLADVDPDQARAELRAANGRVGAVLDRLARD